MFDLLLDAEDPTKDICRKYDVPTWEEYKKGIVLDRDKTTPLQHMATSYTYITSITGDVPRYVVIGKPLIELFIKLKQPIPEKFEEALVTYNVNSPFYCTVIM